eukprot:scaffold1933_cov237-Chaetoceros_neogracile.AAC.1
MPFMNTSTFDISSCKVDAQEGRGPFLATVPKHVRRTNQTDTIDWVSGKQEYSITVVESMVGRLRSVVVVQRHVR